MNRRDLLKSLAALPFAASAGQLLAAPATSSKFLLAFLRGGYDAANLLVPVSSSFYYESRPNIAIARPDDNNPNTALALNADWGLHPALRDSIYPLYQKKQAAFIPFAGTEDLTRSHFETQDSIEMGQPLTGQQNYQSGFLNRLVQVLNGSQTGSQPMAFTSNLPIVFHGATQVPNMAMNNLGKPGIDSRQSSIIASMYKQTQLTTQVSEGFAVRDQVIHDMAAEMNAANRNAISTKGFELVARRIAQLMNERFNVGFVDVGGWDTHVGEGSANGDLANRLGELGRGLAGFADELGPSWSDTVVVVISEFGRTFRENGNRGTDHGHGTVYWVLGGGINGGQVLGDQVAIAQNTLFQNRDYPVLNEYRAVMGGLFGQMYGLNNAQLDQVFSGVRPKGLQLL